MTAEKMPTTQEVHELTEEISAILYGKGVALQGATLIALASMYFAGHHPDIRKGVMNLWIKTMKAMVEVDAAGHPASHWDGKATN